MIESLLEARSVCRRNPAQASWLLRDVSIDLRAGSRTAVVGATGSGKTVLLRALARLDPIDSGEILWRGEPVSGGAIPEYRCRAIYVHQRPALEEGSVEDVLRSPFSLGVHRDREFSNDRIVALMQRVGRDASFLGQSASDLSGGEAQIVALVRAIQLDPLLLLLDEPTAALDEESTRRIEELIAGWFDESPGERAYLWVSHDRNQVDRVADRVVTMRDGSASSDIDVAGNTEEPRT